MNRTETRNLLLKIAAYKPAQTVNPLTLPAWHEALAHISWEDADRALIELAGEVEFIGVHDILKRVKHYRAERIDAGFGALTPPPDLSVNEYLEWSRRARARLANGETADDISGVKMAELPRHDIRALLGPR